MDAATNTKVEVKATMKISQSDWDNIFKAKPKKVEDAMPPHKRLSIGQRVIVVGKVRQGHIGVIKADAKDLQPYRVHFDDGGYHWYCEGDIVKEEGNEPTRDNHR